ncbi:MAG: 30S ribosomal protein S7 [Planctomycetaceae bacterium]|tara:strand:- start:2546 stop:3016 length:471 start_codon:yes stop_codon:yes gene_type:complete
MGKITASKKQLKPDPRFNSVLASKFINCLMLDGKKTVAQNVFYSALDEISSRVPDAEPLDVFTEAVENVKPHIEVRSKRVGGAAYQVPMQVNRNRQQALAFRWILMAVREKKGRPTHLKLADELVAAYKKEGAAITRRENVHRMAEANKAFAHFAW